MVEVRRREGGVERRGGEGERGETGGRDGRYRQRVERRRGQERIIRVGEEGKDGR